MKKIKPKLFECGQYLITIKYQITVINSFKNDNLAQNRSAWLFCPYNNEPIARKIPNPYCLTVERP